MSLGVDSAGAPHEGAPGPGFGAPSKPWMAVPSGPGLGSVLSARASSTRCARPHAMAPAQRRSAGHCGQRWWSTQRLGAGRCGQRGGRARPAPATGRCAQRRSTHVAATTGSASVWLHMTCQV